MRCPIFCWRSARGTEAYLLSPLCMIRLHVLYNSNCLTPMSFCGLYCRYGKVGGDDKPTDCKESTDITQTAPKYRPDLLPKCVCTPGTKCADAITYSAIGPVSSTIIVRVSLGTLLERFGPVNVQSCLTCFGAVWVALAPTIWSDYSFIFIRTVLGCASATFVTAWRVSMLVPAAMFVGITAIIKMKWWDTPHNKRFTPANTGKTSKVRLRTSFGAR